MSEEADPDAAGGRPRGSGSGGSKARGSGGIVQMPWRVPLNPDPPTAPLDAEGIARLHQGVMRILSGIGIEMLNPEAVAILKQAGCLVRGSNIRFGEDFVTEMLGHAPAGFTLTPRNPAHEVAIGGRHMVFLNAASPQHSWDLERGKRPGDFESFRDFLKLTQSFNCLHGSGGYPVEPADIALPLRHLDCLGEMLTLTDKVVHAYSLGAPQISDAMEMVRLAGGLSEAEFAAKPRMFTNINALSPLRHDGVMLDGAMRLARHGQAVVVTPYLLTGASAPASLAGAVALSLAEALSAIALLQYIRPGAPVVLGSFTTGLDRQSGMPVFGTPDYMRATQASGQMARHYRLPLRASGGCSANIPDGQAMLESTNSLWSAVQSGTNMVCHAAGWLEGGLIASAEKVVMDCEMLQMIQHYFEAGQIPTGEADLAYDLIREVGPGGHYFGAGEGRRRRDARPGAAAWEPFVSDRRSYELWSGDGATWTSERAHRIAKQIIHDFEPPEMDHNAREALARFIARRKEEGGAPLA